MTKIFLDTEFTGLHQHTSLLSIGLVAETGEEFYAELTDYNEGEVTEWLRENVMNKMWLATGQAFDKAVKGTYLRGNQNEVTEALRQWLEPFEAIEIWADVLAWDWVLFCELFGGAMYIPENIFYAPFDTGTLFRYKGLTRPVSKYAEDPDRYEFAGADAVWRHNALADARMEMICLQKLLADE
ncbi:MAG: 3'-5' exoribonuclease [Chitinophagaceae bacterium]|nr:3'-5' exoribonuclease [Chitinophagaceae bacterium]